MRRLNKYYIFLIALILIFACSTQKNYKTLSFFFDGVPEPVNDSLKVQTDSLKTDSLNVLALLIPEMYYHEPYKTKECSSCHDQGTMGKLIENQPVLCYQCHDDFNDSNKTLHGAIDAGSCTDCHNPHQSKEEKLLIKSGESLCFNCHDSEAVKENQFHSIAEETNCITCHNPHGGENHFILQKGACYKCHDDFKNQFKHLHGPVAGGYCMDCHTPHIEGTGNLIRKGQDLCLYCHDKELIFKNENHADVGDSGCTDCHNPHGGENRSILN
ncbi:MAG TPA: cytochrome c3 family protein [Draconibacterium sp.]|nr:cytochrome c3 family protein [Draconibacterium sp.]